MKKNCITSKGLFLLYNFIVTIRAMRKKSIRILITIISGLLFFIPVSTQDLQNELVVLDESMDNRKEIISSLNENVKIIILKQSNNQLKDLTDSLKSYQELTALHLLLCGKEGLIMLNGSPINNQNMGELSDELSQWKKSFRDNGDLLIYTCKLANTDGGKLVIRRLSAYTGLDVAASVNDTGNIGKESDWDLEFMSGPVEAASCFNFQKIKKFPGKFQRSADL